ncbi:MAG: helix-turn-helix domain-containing protein [Clostridium sp.]
MGEKIFEVFMKSKRIELGLTLREAAELIGISHSYISIIEKGLDPRTNCRIKLDPKIVKKISNAYGVDFNYLLYLLGCIDDPSYLEIVHETSSDLVFAFNNFFDILDKKNDLSIDGKAISDENWNLLKNSFNLYLTGLKYSVKTSSSIEKTNNLG